jgi:DNA-binding MarR family transcriptional regulator
VKTLEARRYVTRRKGAADGRLVIVSLTPEGRTKIEHLFPRFNAEEVAVTDHLEGAQQEALASMLRSLLRRAGAEDRPDADPARSQ